MHNLNQEEEPTNLITVDVLAHQIKSGKTYKQVLADMELIEHVVPGLVRKYTTDFLNEVFSDINDEEESTDAGEPSQSLLEEQRTRKRDSRKRCVERIANSAETYLKNIIIVRTLPSRFEDSEPVDYWVGLIGIHDISKAYSTLNELVDRGVMSKRRRRCGNRRLNA